MTLGKLIERLLLLFRAFAFGDIIVGFQNVPAVSLRIAVQRPAREHGNPPAVASRVNEFPLPVIIPEQLLINSGQRLGVFCFQQIMAHFAERFLQRVAVDFRRPFVPVSNPIVYIANDDRIVAQIKQPRLLGQLLFVTLALR